MLLIKNAKQVVTVCDNGEKLLCGEEAKTVKVCDASESQGYSIVIDNCGRIEAIGFDEDIKKNYVHASFDIEINATGKCVLPGNVFFE